MFSRISAIFLAATIASISCQVAFAGESFEQFAQSMSYTGATFFKKTVRGVTNIDIRFNENTLIGAIPALQRAGLFNPDISQTAINLAPISMSSVLVQEIGVTTLMFVYQNTAADKITMNSYLQVANDYGHLEDHLATSFSFDRKLYQKIDWNNFQLTSFPKVAHGFKYSRWIVSKVSAEQN